MEQINEFNKLNFFLTTAPILKQFDHSWPAKVEVDATHGALAGVFIQKKIKLPGIQ